MSEFLQTAIDAAKEAEDVILRYFDKGVDVKYKSDQTPVTEADTGAEAIIKEVIGAAFPDHSFIGEETGLTGTESGYVWIIDPIDGTKNFVRKLPFFGTLIALMRDGEFIVGVSNAPVMKELVYAEKGSGAFMNGTRIHVSATSDMSRAYVGHGGLSRFNTNGRLPGLVSLVSGTHACRGFGDLWSYNLLAQGKIDIVAEAGLKVWDVAPAAVIINEAGGKMTDLDGKPIGLDTTTALATNGILHEASVEHFRTKLSGVV